MRRLFALLFALVLTAPVAAQPAPPAPAVEYDKPGPEHALLASIAGRWTSVYHVTSRPGAKPVDVPGTAEFRTTLSGLWIDGDTRLQMGESRIDGRVVYGFDRFKGQYVFLFLQERDTQPLFGYGTADSTGRRITFTVPMDLPVVNLRAVPVRTVLDLSVPDRLTFEMNTPIGGGKEYQPLRIDYVRAK